LGAGAAVFAARAAPNTKMTIELSCGAIGVKADQLQALQYAHRFGFESVEADSGWLASQPPDAVKGLLDDMRAKKIVWANAGLPVEFRKSEEEFQNGLKGLPARAAALEKAGVKRVSTWLMPVHDTLTYRQNFDLTSRRLREAADILEDYGQRLGIEYVAPKTIWSSRRYPFVHTMREMKELIAAISQQNVGFVLDSWHWYTAGESTADLATLKNVDIVSIDLNDAPAGVAVDQQIDSVRELPCATGVIDLRGFLNTLNQIGCDAPVRCEPFNAALRKLEPEQALEQTIAAMRKAFALIGS
jgi:sugar phosphate isomerase/epimerase